MQIDIYDFDKTLVPFDSGSLFIGYCMARYPWCLFYTPVILVAGILTLLGLISFTQFKKTCFGFVKFIPLQTAVEKFWDRHEKFVFPWFQEQKDRPKVVISASPDFLLNEIQRRLNFDTLICTRHNAKNGTIIGENCRGKEKVKRLYELYNKEDIQVVDVYSDSLKHDKWIFSLATGKCFNIQGSKRVEFNYNEMFKGEK